MSFAEVPGQTQVVSLLQRSLERGRLGHAYLFTGPDLGTLEIMARTLAKTLNCLEPRRSPETGAAIDCCDHCLACRKIASENHPDIQWVRPESKSRVITIDQVRALMQTVHLKPTEAEYKVAVVVSTERMNIQAANAFLKTLEEPPSRSILILLSTQPAQVLETILSRCLRLGFADDGVLRLGPAMRDWLAQFSTLASSPQNGLLGRYQLLGSLLDRLAALKEAVAEDLGSKSKLERYDDIETNLRDKWEDELAAAVEAEYRRQRLEVLAALQWWLRDIWLQTLAVSQELLSFGDLVAATETVARRLTPAVALKNLQVLEETQRLLGTNVQEALALEVGLLKLKL